MGPGYPDPMSAGSADPGAQCSDEQHMALGAWSVKQRLFPRVADWSSGREEPRYRFNLSAVDRMAEGSEPAHRPLRAPRLVRPRRMTSRIGSQSTGCRADRLRIWVPIISEATHASPTDASLMITKYS